MSDVPLRLQVVADRLFVCGGGAVQTSVEGFDFEVGVRELLQPMLEQHSFVVLAVLHGQLCMCGGDDEYMPTSTVERFHYTRNF